MKIHAVINRSSHRANRPSLHTALRQRLAGHELTLARTNYSGHGTALAREAVRRGADLVIAIGGDGTVNEVLNGIIGTETRLAIIPAGTANDVASYFGLSEDISLACDTILTGHATLVDSMRVNGWHCLGTGGFGLPCDVIARTDRFRRTCGTGRHLANLLRNWIYPSGLLAALTREPGGGRMKIDTGSESLEADPLSLTLSNIPRLGRHFWPAPEARPDDGLIDLCLIENRGRFQAAAVSFSVGRGKHQSRRDVRCLRAAHLIVSCDRPRRFFGDGEVRSAATVFEVNVRPKAIRLITPLPAEAA